MQLETIIKRRHSIRSYSSKKVKWHKIISILDAARFAPFAGNLCTIKLILVSDKEKIQKIADAAGQEFIAIAPCLIILCSDPTLAINAYGQRGIKYSKQQAGAAIQSLLLKITDLGLASCWIGAFDDDKMREILKIPENIEIEAILPLAHKSIIRESKRKEISLQDILYFEQFGNKRRKAEKMAR